MGQSSWGPTGFAFFDSDVAAHSMLRELQSQFTHLPQLGYKVVQGNNEGAVMTLADNVADNDEQSQNDQNSGQHSA